MNKRIKDILEWVYCIIIALVLALLFRYFICNPTIVKQRSMFPTLKEGQRLILNRTFRIKGYTPNRGDIITFEAPSGDYEFGDYDQTNPIAKYDEEERNFIDNFVYYILELSKKSYIKRVIGIPGDHVKIEEGKVFVNGKELEEEYLEEDVITESRVFNDIIVPEGYVFALGDNRPKSTDCRLLGCIPLEKIEGIVVLRFWPFDVFGKIE